MFDPKTGKYVRRCKFCGKVLPGEDGVVTGAPLQEDGKLWLFCSSDHKENWDRGRKTIAQLQANADIEFI